MLSSVWRAVISKFGAGRYVMLYCNYWWLYKEHSTVFMNSVRSGIGFSGTPFIMTLLNSG